jgi:hypothetical protein
MRVKLQSEQVLMPLLNFFQVGVSSFYRFAEGKELTYFYYFYELLTGNDAVKNYVAI